MLRASAVGVRQNGWMKGIGLDLREVVCPLKCGNDIAHETGHSPSTQVGGEEVEHLQWQGRVTD